jgi:hypothetical protein
MTTPLYSELHLYRFTVQMHRASRQTAPPFQRLILSLNPTPPHIQDTVGARIQFQTTKRSSAPVSLLRQPYAVLNNSSYLLIKYKLGSSSGYPHPLYAAAYVKHQFIIGSYALTAFMRYIQDACLNKSGSRTYTAPQSSFSIGPITSLLAVAESLLACVANLKPPRASPPGTSLGFVIPDGSHLS